MKAVVTYEEALMGANGDVIHRTQSQVRPLSSTLEEIYKSVEREHNHTDWLITKINITFAYDNN